MITEEWKDIKGYEGIYKISNFGNVMRLYKTKTILMHPTNGKAGYPLIALSKHNKRKLYTVHRLVAEAFIPKVHGKKYIDHIDGNRSNNNVSNLRWCTFKENCRFPIAVKNRQDSHAKSHGIAIIQCNVDGVEINRFASMAEAERFTGIWRTNIHRASRLGRAVSPSYSDGNWEIVVDTTDTRPRGCFWLRSRNVLKELALTESLNRLVENVHYWFGDEFDSYFKI